MKIGAIIQARASSTRLPNKIFKELPYGSGIPVLKHIIDRLKKVDKINEVIIATSEDSSDNSVENFCKENNISCFRGSLPNVLSRFYYAAKMYDFDVVCRFTGDNPCLDIPMMNDVVNHFGDKFENYLHSTGFPNGTNIEVFTFDILEYAFNNAIEAYDIEHVTPFIIQRAKDIDKFRVLNYDDFKHDEPIRLTLDTPQDYSFLCSVFNALYDKNIFFETKDVYNLLNSNPWLRDLNANVFHKRKFMNINEELIEAENLLRQLELNNAADIIKINRL
ncbi:MAG: hypothetical protein A2X12_00900 [Bacteroidetes bacterium GWE2_29_8]|nr:MAG: hypothetical protein A2X12_00900 [Bacteroidetes bacterium GWE2_29_8]OFY15635.1 MAG: hypothetical protein A2X02_06370 [Bacteroidetes bacterium GWF2_29_10]